MIKKNLIYALVIVASALVSCNKDDNKGTGTGTDPFNAPYNGASIDENKATLEDNGIQLVNEIDQIKDLDAIAILVNFSKIESGSSAKNAVLNRALAPLKTASTASSVKAIFSALESVAEEDPIGVADLWNELVGRYTYNFDTDEFDYSDDVSDAVIFEFPGLETDLTNTATITINDFAYQTLVDPVIEIDSTIKPQLPTSLHITLSYEGAELASFDYSASFEDNGIPLSFSSILTIGDFSFSVTMTHDPYNNATNKNSFKHGADVLIETFVEANGDWSEENIDDNTVTETDTTGWDWIWDEELGDYVYGPVVEEVSEITVENIVENANAYIQVINIKVAGLVDFKSLVPEIKALDAQYDIENPTITEQAYYEQTAIAINKYAKLVVVTANDNKKISEAEAYAYEDESDEWNIDVRFVFEDGSKVDAETYFSEGFEGFVDAINTVIDEINADYDAGIEPIVY
jgi:hypothetical protein